MSLSEWEQQALDSIKDRLAGSDPSLVAFLATFTRLAAGEEMPAREKIRAGSRRAGRRLRRKRRNQHRDKARRHAHRVYDRLGYSGIALLLWLLVAVALIAVALTISHSSSDHGACPKPWPICADSAPAPGSRPPRTALLVVDEAGDVAVKGAADTVDLAGRRRWANEGGLACRPDFPCILGPFTR